MKSPFRNPPVVSAAAACVAATLLVLAASIPRDCAAAEALYLDWNDCVLGTSATSDFTSSCAADSGSQDLYVAFSLDTPLTDVVAIRVVVDLQHQAGSLPPWWQLAPDGCRFGGLVQSAQFDGGNACGDYWAGAGSFDMPPPFFVGLPGNQASRARIQFTIGVPSDQARSLPSTTTIYYAARLMLENIGTWSCVGCMEGACLVLNSIEIFRPGLDPVVLTTPGPDHANWVTWQGGGSADCTAVPVRAVTWGQIKSLYR